MSVVQCSRTFLNDCTGLHTYYTILQVLLSNVDVESYSVVHRIEAAGKEEEKNCGDRDIREKWPLTGKYTFGECRKIYPVHQDGKDYL